MVNNHHKSPELIKAQIATYSAERVEDYRDKKHLLENLGDLAAGNVVNVTRTLTKPEFIQKFRSEDNRAGQVEAGTTLTIARAEDYKEFLTKVGGRNYEPIRKRAEILESYAEFKDIVARLRQELIDPTKRSEHSSIIGAGSNSQVFRVEKDGRAYAVRIPASTEVKPVTIDEHLAATVLVSDVPHYEHIVAASYEDGVTVAELMSGKESNDLTLNDISKITDEQLSEFIDTLVIGQERGVIVDPKPSNYFYDAQNGFGIVDLHSSKTLNATAGIQSLGDKIGEAAAMLDNMGIYGKSYVEGVNETPEYYSEALQYAKAHIDILMRYRNLVAQKIENTDAEKALVMIDERIHSTQNTITNYSDPEWVGRHIEKTRQRRIQREEEIKAFRENRQLDSWDKATIKGEIV